MISANRASYYYIHMFWLALYDARSRQPSQLLIITNLVIKTSAFTFAEGCASDTSRVAFAPSGACQFRQLQLIRMAHPTGASLRVLDWSILVAM